MGCCAASSLQSERNIDFVTPLASSELIDEQSEKSTDRPRLALAPPSMQPKEGSSPKSLRGQFGKKVCALAKVSEELVSSRFPVKLTRAKSQTPWGVLVEHIPGLDFLLIVGFSSVPGVVQEYNKAACALKQLRKYDCIVSANGATDSDAMFETLKSENAVSISVVRPSQIAQAIPTCGSPLDLTVKQNRNGHAMYVAEVSDKRVMSPSSAKISKGDVIIGINGKDVNHKTFVAEVRKRDSVELQLLRLG